MSTYAWRPMQSRDITDVVLVARESFPDHFEGQACFEERLHLFPKGCFALASEENVRGYLITYPWPEGTVPPLNSALGALPEDQGVFYLHDLALHPDVRGQGHTRPIVARMVEVLKELGARKVALVSVNDSVPFWQGMGFEPVVADEAMTKKLASYGEDSTYMIMGLD